MMRGRSPCCAPSLSAARLAHSASAPAGVDSGDDSTVGVSSGSGSGGGGTEAEAPDPRVDGVQSRAPCVRWGILPPHSPFDASSSPTPPVHTLPPPSQHCMLYVRAVPHVCRGHPAGEGGALPTRCWGLMAAGSGERCSAPKLGACNQPRPPLNPPFALLLTSRRPPLNLLQLSLPPYGLLPSHFPHTAHPSNSSLPLCSNLPSPPPLLPRAALPCCPMLSPHSLFPPRPSAHGSPSHRLQPGSVPAQGTPGRRSRRRGRRTDIDAEESKEEIGVRGVVGSEEGSGEGAVKEGGLEAGGDGSNGVVGDEMMVKSDERGGEWEPAQGGECVRSNDADRGDASGGDGSGDEKSLGSGRVELEGLDKARGSAALMGEGQRGLDHVGVGKGGRVHPFHPHVRVTGGVLGEECAQVMRDFFTARRKQQAEERRGRKAREGLVGS
ncbi:unnamed protein product [Closterium sp. Naga37s-1]|nr:unnamed protein product [Closterium sp. Naga37s-1]